MKDSDRIPLMYQAQIAGRCQVQRLADLRNSTQTQQQAYDWTNQWQGGCDERTVPTFGADTQVKEYQFNWRMVTNSGQDAGVIRPVIGGRGWAYFPGSSMKGAFVRACRRLCDSATVLRYCGGSGKDGEMHPGILRFQGGYPTDAQWLDDSMVDVVHPQEDWQVKDQASHSALIQVSLYRPKFQFGISSTEVLGAQDWDRIWEIWQAALAKGIGSRVSAGYGQVSTHGDSKLLLVGLQGQGLASQRIDKSGEFRPNMFKAALRGHTRRLFSGITDDATAEYVTKQLWGGFLGSQGAVVGLLGVAAPSLRELDAYRYGKNNVMPTYATDDLALTILMMKEVSEEQKKELGKFTKQLIQFSMLLGGFGKSWRRIDHRLFFPQYLNNKPMIGCHWQFVEGSLKAYYIPINREMTNITAFLNSFQNTLKNLSIYTNAPQKKPPQGNLREAWQKGRVQVWGRIAQDDGDSLAVKWFHGPYLGSQTIYKSELTGRMGRISRIWHRMYPRYRKKDETLIATSEYVELLTIFPNREGNNTEVQKTKDFLKSLADSGDFVQLW